MPASFHYNQIMSWKCLAQFAKNFFPVMSLNDEPARLAWDFDTQGFIKQAVD